MFLLDYIYNVDLYHVLFNSLERLGRTEEARQVSIQGVNAFEQVPWEQSLFKLSIGGAQLAAVASEAVDDLQYCRAHYYAGSSLVTQGDLDGAVRALEVCLAVAGNAQVDCLERELAKAELASIEKKLDKSVPMLELRRCADAYRRQDYAECARLAIPLVTQIVSPDLCHLLLISLHRLGLINERDQYGALFLKMLSFDEWQCLLLNLTLGKTAISTVISQATGDEQLCQAYYYDGARLITVGQIAAGFANMEKCLSFNTNCVERQFAEDALKSNRLG